MDDDLQSSIHESPRASSPVRKHRRSARLAKGTTRASSAQGRRSSKPSTSASLQELQTEMMLRTYRGRTDSFTGLDPKQKVNAPYASTSHFLRQTVGIEREKTSDLPTSRVSARTPHYKTQEEYYDEVIALKKQIQELNNDNSMFKLKLRRVEEDYIKKKREVEQLLDPVKNDQVRRTLAESKPESGMVVHGLKQKILKLEEQVREKEAAYSKLQSDLKTTKFEETKLALEVCFNEIQRLRNEKLLTTPSSPRKQAVPKENVSKLRALTAQIMKSNIEKNRLLLENKSLKEDLVRCMESKQDKSSVRARKEYEDMNKRELLAAITRLEKKMEHSEAANGDVDNGRAKPLQVDEGKVALEGNVKERLDRLDKRETELLEKVEQQTNTIKKLKEDRAYYHTKCDEKDAEIKALKKEIDTLQKQLDNSSKRTRTPEPSLRSADSRSPRSTERSLSRRNSAEERDRLRKSEELRQNHAARRIQAGWRQHRARDSDNDDDDDENVALLQSALRGHLLRQKNAEKLRSSRRPSGSTYSTSVNDSELEETAEMLQSNLRAHHFRKQMLSRRGSSSQGQRGSKPNSRASSRGNSDDELGSTGLVSRLPARSSPATLGRLSPQTRGRSTPSRNSDVVNSDSEDEIVLSSNKGRTKNAKQF